MKQECDYFLDKGELFLYGYSAFPHYLRKCALTVGAWG